MKTVRAVLLIGFVWAFGGVSGYGETVRPGMFKREAGEYVFDQSGSVLRTIAAKDGQLSVEVEFKWKDKNSKSSSKTGFTERGILRGEKWFVFFESARRVWFFDGVDNVYRIEHKRDAFEANTTTSSLDGGTIKNIPKKMWRELPERVRAKVEAI